METQTLSATRRKDTGKGPAHRLRAQGLVPAILYGPRMETALGVAVKPDDLRVAINTPKKFNTIIQLKLDDGSERYVLFKAYEVDPVERKLLHADFLEVRLDEKVKVNVPVVLTGKPQGVVDGGILSQARYDIELWCLPKDIPVKIEIDVSPLKIGNSIHVKDLKLPPGVEAKFQTNFTIAAVVAPEKEEEVAAPAAAVEGAVVEGAAAVPGAAPGAPGAAPAAGAAPGAPGAAPGAPGVAPAAGKAAAPGKGAEAKGGKEKK
jgi:large subunit ribosomal protein L25